MVDKSIIKENLDNCLNDTGFLNLPGKRVGKVRDTYQLDDRLVLITTDRQSAFDRVLASIPFKGEVLNRTSEFWFNECSDIVQSHVLSIPDPNVTVAKKCRVFPVEFVMRGYLTGSTSTSAWTQYNNGVRNICGNTLPDGMVKNQKLDRNILTPTTKSDEHDESISAREIKEKGIIDSETWERLSDIAFALFSRGQEIARKNGLILVDTKYEFGLDAEGNITLIDEIHTPDSSRYWLAETYEERIRNGQEPENIDKEFLRLWFMEHCDPYNDKELPSAPEDLIIELSHRYMRLFELITGKEFKTDYESDIKQRILDNLKDLK